MPRDVLVVGGSGLVGRALLRRLAATGCRPRAITRAAAPATDVAALARWHCGTGLDGPGALPAGDRIAVLLGAGPLDVLAQWLERTPLPGLQRVVALSSTSAATKADSPDGAERELARRLARSEQRLAAACDARGVAWTVLRPTLIWGEGRDRNVSALAGLARRTGGLLPLPRFARGRRQPIRADDVAAAMLAAAETPAAAGLRLDLPGGETLPYDVMAARIAAAVSPRGRVLRLPVPVWAVRLAGWLGTLGDGHLNAVLRTRQDLVFDGEPAWRLLGHVPRGFDPVAADFPPA